MVARKQEETPKRRGRPASTPEEREAELVNLAYTQIENQLIKGEASSQVLAHLLKRGTQREKLEEERLRNENLLLQARVQQIEDAKDMKELYAGAIRAMSKYHTGRDPSEGDLDDPDFH